ncbi:hypothetical protein EBU24_06180, partial [bacterium]|nr:hypothetical protein [bacterium]
MKNHKKLLLLTCISLLFTNSYAAPTITDTKSAPSKSFEDKVVDKAGNVINKGIEAAGKGIKDYNEKRNIKSCEGTLILEKNGLLDKTLKTGLEQSKINFLPSESLARLRLKLAQCMCNNVKGATLSSLHKACT